MARQRKEKGTNIRLRQPDRSGPSEATLLDLADERNLFEQAKLRERQLKEGVNASNSGPGPVNGGDPDAVISIGAERFLEAMLWTATMAMLHFTLDVLVQNQYGVDVQWDMITFRTAIAWFVFFVIFYPLHPHEANPVLLPGLPLKYQRPLRQVIFTLMSAISGCALIYVTNSKGYLAVMKRAPPLACLWVWAVIELDLPWAVLSLSVAGGFLWIGGYSVK